MSSAAKDFGLIWHCAAKLRRVGKADLRQRCSVTPPPMAYGSPWVYHRPDRRKRLWHIGSHLSLPRMGREEPITMSPHSDSRNQWSEPVPPDCYVNRESIVAL